MTFGNDWDTVRWSTEYSKYYSVFTLVALVNVNAYTFLSTLTSGPGSA